MRIDLRGRFTHKDIECSAICVYLFVVTCRCTRESIDFAINTEYNTAKRPVIVDISVLTFIGGKWFRLFRYPDNISWEIKLMCNELIFLSKHHRIKVGLTNAFEGHVPIDCLDKKKKYIALPTQPPFLKTMHVYGAICCIHGLTTSTIPYQIGWYFIDEVE